MADLPTPVMDGAVAESRMLAERLGVLLVARCDAPYTVARVCTTIVGNSGGTVSSQWRRYAGNTLRDLYARLVYHRIVQRDLVTDTLVCVVCN